MILYLLQENNFSATTINTYRKTISKYSKQVFLTTEGMIKFVGQIAKKLEPTTCQNYVCALTSYAKWQNLKDIDWGKINSLIPKIQKKFYTIINEQELASLKQARFERFDLSYQRNNLVLDFLFYTGIRISELINIRHRDYQNNALWILGKGNKVRYVFLPPFLAKHVKFGSSNYLFSTTNDTKLHPGNIRKNISRRVKLAGLKKIISPHTFRRSFASILHYDLGLDSSSIQQLLGHSQFQTTERYLKKDVRFLLTNLQRKGFLP